LAQLVHGERYGFGPIALGTFICDGVAAKDQDFYQ
jgi:hypothetical protein